MSRIGRGVQAASRIRLGLEALPGVALAVVLAGFSLPTLATLHPYWTAHSYSHGYLVAATTAALIAREGRRCRGIVAAPSWLGLPSVVAAALLVVAGHAASAMLVAQAALPLVWLGSVWAAFGARWAVRLSLPIGYFYFAVPFWDVLQEPLRTLTVQVVSNWIRLADIPAFIVGDLIHIPSGTFQVAGGCSGQNYVVVGLALASYIAITEHDRNTARAILCCAAVGLAMLTNWLRVFVIVAAGHATDMQHYLVVRDHYYFGWALFLLCVGPPLLLLDRVIKRRVGSAAPEERGGEAPPAQPPGERRAYAVRLIVIGALSAGIWMNGRVAAVPDAGPGPTGVVAMPNVGRWSVSGEWQGTARPSFVGAAAEGAAWYERDGVRVAAYVAHYSRQSQGREVVYYANRPEGNDGRVQARSATSIMTASGATFPFEELTVADARGGRRLVWVGLRIAGVPAANVIVAKALQVAGAVTGRQDAQALVLSAACGRSCDAARDALLDFSAAAAEALYSSARGTDGS